MKRKTPWIQIGMVALASLFGGMQPAVAVERSVPVSQIPVRSNDAILEKRKVRESQHSIAIRGNSSGADLLFPSIASSPIWFGKSQRKKHLNMKHVSKATKAKHKRKAA